MADIPARRAASTSDVSQSRQGRRAWLALALGAAAAVYSVAFGLAVVQDTSNPVLAKAVYGGLPAPSERLADLAIGNASQRALKAQGTTVRPGALPPSLISGIGITLPRESQARISALALDALTATPLSSEALRQLAYIESDQTRRVRLLSLAQAVTRRDVLANLQLAELQLRRNAVASGLAALNQSLVISRTIDNAVFPILLTAAGASTTAAREVGGLLTGDPIWSERMLGWSIGNPQYLPALSRIVGYLPSTSPARVSGYGQQVIDQLVTQRRYEEAFRTYRVYAGRPAGVTTLTAGAFPPLDWKLIDNFDTGSRVFEDGVIELFANPGRRGQVAQLYTQLPGGPRQLTLRISETVGSGANLTFAATCLEGETERLVTEQQAPLRNGVQAFRYTVPATGCAFQRIDLGIVAGNDTGGALLRLAEGQAAAPGNAQAN